MRRLYVTTKDVWAGNAQDLKGNPITHTVSIPQPPVMNAGGNWTPQPPKIQTIYTRHIDLFNPVTGSAYIDLDSTYVLVSTDVEHSEYCAEIWHSHPAVARLPHPVYEGTVTLQQLLTDPAHTAKQFKQVHMNALINYPHFSVVPTDTVLTLGTKAKAIKPGVRIGNIL